MNNWKRVRNGILSGIAELTAAVCGCLPLRVNRAIGYVLGGVFFAFDRRYRARVDANIARAFPDMLPDRRREVARRCYRTLGMNLFELFAFPRLRTGIHRHVRFHGDSREVLYRAYNAGRGVIFFTAHVGNWEMLGAAVSLSGCRLSVIARDFYIPRLNDLVNRMRRSVGETVVGRGPAGTMSIRSFLHALRNGDVIGVLVDQNIRGVKSAMVPFLGIPAPTPIGIAELVLKYRIPSVVGFARREGTGYTVLVRELPLERFDDATALMGEVNDEISGAIRLDPEQWTWMHQRWNGS
jgi:KDO2-lipid IV(A) lauroyltransferase